MGLDNGIIVKNLEPGLAPYPNYWDTEEICYWRKCYSIRDFILNNIHEDEENDEYFKYLNLKDIKIIRRYLKSLLNKEYFKNHYRGIWSYKEMKGNLKRQRKNLKWLKTYLKEYPETKCYFYDSY